MNIPDDIRQVIANALRTAAQLAEVASDWNLDEVEIDGEMVSIYDVLDQMNSALALLLEQAQQPQPGAPSEVRYVIKKALERYRNRIAEVGTMEWYNDPKVTSQEIARIDAALEWLEQAQQPQPGAGVGE